VILDKVQLHERERLIEIHKSVKKYFKQLLFTFSLSEFKRKVKPLDYIADYKGEKWAFYFAWLIHYTSFLIIPSIIGLIVYLIELSVWLNNLETTTYVDE
jgi:hypothetical protein